MNAICHIYLPKQIKISLAKEEKDIFYIGGNDILPPPLDYEKES